jgi:hypothetical protein
MQPCQESLDDSLGDDLDTAEARHVGRIQQV